MNWQEEITEFKAYLLLERGVSPHTIEAYVRDITEFSTDVQEIPADRIGTEQIEAYLRKIDTLSRSNTSQARSISGVKSFFNYLVIYDKIAQSPMELIETPKIRRKIPDVLTLEEVEMILAAVVCDRWTDYRNRAMIEMLYGCGLRVSELIAIRHSDLFLQEGVLRVKGKGNKERLVPLNDTLTDSIAAYLDALRAEKSFPGSDLLFLNNRGAALSREMVFMMIRKVAAAAGIAKKISPHTFRHTFATHLIKGGADIRVVQDMLGHESIVTTEIYTHLDTRHKREVLDQYHPLTHLKR